MRTDSVFTAVKSCDLKSIKRLIQAGADVNAKDITGWTPLQYASHGGHTKVVTELITAGADIDLKDGVGWTALHCAAAHGHEAVVAVLIAAGAEINAKDTDRWTPLHHAAHEVHEAVIDSLIAAGAEVNPRGIFGSTPLEVSLKKGPALTLIASGGTMDPRFWEILNQKDRVIRGDINDAFSMRLHKELARPDVNIECVLIGEDGQLTPNGVDYARAHLLPGLFAAAHWRGREAAGLEFYDKLVRAIPDPLRAECVPELDLTTLRRAATARARATDGPTSLVRYVRPYTTASGPGR